MGSHLFSLRWPLRVAVAVLMVSAVAAQPPATNGWQKIIFSSPDKAQISSNLSFVTGRSSSSTFENKLRLFQDSSPAVLESPPLSAAPVPMPSRVRPFPNSSEDNLPWEFMTPAQILGVAPDQTVQSKKRNAQDDQNSLTPMERYLQGRSTFVQFQTNSAGHSFRGQNLWPNGMDQTNSVSPGLFSSVWGNLQSNVSSPFLGNTPADNWSGGPSGNSVWPKMFGSSASRPSFNPEQPQSDMNQFMQLLNPNSTPAPAAAAAPEETPSFKPQTVWSESDSTAPSANPIGASIAPLSSGIIKPAGLAPLPSITQPAAVRPVAPPAWAPQQPPWLSSMPQPFAVPQRKF